MEPGVWHRICYSCLASSFGVLCVLATAHQAIRIVRAEAFRVEEWFALTLHACGLIALPVAAAGWMRRRMVALAFFLFLSSWVISWASVQAAEKTILLCFEWYAIVLLAVGLHLEQRRRNSAGSQCPKEVSCVWAPCRFDQRQRSPEFYSFEVKAGDPISWTPSAPTPLVAPTLVGDLQTCLCCLEDFEETAEVAILPCGHIFHQECVAAWSVCQVSSNCRCPTCSRSFVAPHHCA
mmetsp:Transcript_16362/g.33926  ORF Transcript_16362/g.33926 Transcript_16362/m.33926 type:complete len:236 (+) Transcript_16362:27-734(+)